jgi:predicted transcriptional regulator
VGKIKYKIAKQGDKWQIDEIKDLRTALDQPDND